MRAVPCWQHGAQMQELALAVRRPQRLPSSRSCGGGSAGGLLRPLCTLAAEREGVGRLDGKGARQGWGAAVARMKRPDLPRRRRGCATGHRPSAFTAEVLLCGGLRQLHQQSHIATTTWRPLKSVLLSANQRCPQERTRGLSFNIKENMYARHEWQRRPRCSQRYCSACTDVGMRLALQAAVLCACYATTGQAEAVCV